MTRTLRGFTMLELMVVIAIISILSAISIPNFVRFQARSKQSEAKANLKALYVSEKAYLQEKDVYSPRVSQIGFAPERGNRYQYNLNGTSSANSDDRTGTIPSTSNTADAIMIDTFKFPAAYTDAPLVAGACSTAVVVPGPVTASFVATAQGNIDNDSTGDQWSISSVSRDLSACASVGGNDVSGDPANDLNDVVR